MFVEHVHIFELLWLCIVIQFNAIQAHHEHKQVKFTSKLLKEHPTPLHNILPLNIRKSRGQRKEKKRRRRRQRKNVTLRTGVFTLDLCSGMVRTQHKCSHHPMCSKLINNCYYRFIISYYCANCSTTFASERVLAVWHINDFIGTRAGPLLPFP